MPRRGRPAILADPDDPAWVKRLSVAYLRVLGRVSAKRVAFAFGIDRRTVNRWVQAASEADHPAARPLRQHGTSIRIPASRPPAPGDNDGVVTTPKPRRPRP